MPPEVTVNLPPLDALRAVCAGVVSREIECANVEEAAQVVADAMRTTFGPAYETMPMTGAARRCQWLVVRADAFPTLGSFSVALALVWQE